MNTLCTILCLWIGTNALHAVWVGARRTLWERRFLRDEDSLLPRAASYTVGSGPTAILFIHGFADTPHIWKRMCERLAGSGGFTCRAMRLPGCAEPARQAERQSLDLWRQAVDREIDALREGSRTVWLAGHSMGAALAIDAALRRPEAAAGLIALAPLIAVSKRRSPLLPPSVWLQLARVTLCLSPTFESCFSEEGVAVDDPSFTYQRDRFIPFCVYRSLFELVRANRDRAPDMIHPLFMVTAERDSVVDTPSALRWFAECPGPKTILARSDIGHVVPLEIGWQGLTDSIATFVQQAPLAADTGVPAPR
jgi:pimeloyl-ACP methyl ester carboxylesterase